MWKKFVIMAFFFNGLCLLFSKILVQAGLGSHNLFYLFVFYSAGFLWSLFFCLKDKIVFGKKEIFTGMGAGISSFLGSLFLMFALNKVPGTIVYPVAVGGNLVTVTIFAVIIFREKIGFRAVLGIVTGVVGLILISI
ncbi:hypothetical protein CO111_01425 [Candidatus Desantisbacteria bacterium CG_4_9_14_3_um_filter_50_7]|nr:MAG: hypothetical protein CO111_01425 [Candidatus Desantisbacteria bacterium CG_4_9_14_3_um_filter_50_7]